MELWYFAHPKFGGRTISLRPPRKLYKPRSPRPMNRTLPGCRDLRPALFSGG